ncbi:MAG: pyridoxal phosphate-dependent aminotransferase [Candidatus Odinarchaeota archaeon]
MKFHTEDIMYPPILKLAEAAKRYVASPDFLDLGQGLPGHIPPDKALASLRERLSHPSTHLYTTDQGLLELREELSLYLRQTAGIDINPQTELVITAGANNAFAGAAQTLIGPNENVIMPTPYYFNSVMAVKLTGGNVKEIHTNANFQVVSEDIEKAIDANTRGIFLVSPNNPTGAVYERKTIDSIVDICLNHDLVLFSDETYSRMVFDGSSHYSPRLRRDATENVITIGSFSKDFGMSGWRVGYVIGPSQFIEQYLKVQDTVTICAPTAGQLLALEVLKNGLDAVEQEIERLNLLRELAYVRIREIDQLEVIRTSGTFYMFPKVRDCTDSSALVLDILQSTGTLVLPGIIFGEAGEGHIRISIGPLTPEAVDEAFDRLYSYFAT